MKRLTCEMCGSTDLMKENGVFICQTCGCKYSVEEAKKMMVEGTVEVTGTVKVDNSDQIDNSLQLARRYLNEGNDANAEKYFEMVLQANPNSWEATFYLAYCHARNCRIKDIGEVSSGISNSLSGVFQLIKKNIHSVEEQKKIVQEISKKTMELAELLFLNAFPQNKTLEDIQYQNQHLDEFFNRYYPATRIFYSLGDTVAEEYAGDSDMELIACSAWEKGLKCHKKYVNGYGRELSKPMVDFYQIRISEIKAAAESRKLQEQRERNEHYWEEHFEDKAKLDARIIAIGNEAKQLQEQVDICDSRIAEIRKDLSQTLASEQQLAEIKRQQSDLMNQKSQLGLFAGKQKKQLQAQIDALQPQINDLEENVSRQKKAIQDDVSARVAVVEAERKPIVDRINALESEKKQINTELTKDR